MTEMNNIPDINDSWIQAEKMLDRHFMKKRIIKWMFILLIPAMGLVTYMYLDNKSIPSSEKVSMNAGNVIDNKENSIVNGIQHSSDVKENSTLNPSANSDSKSINSKDIQTGVNKNSSVQQPLANNNTEKVIQPNIQNNSQNKPQSYSSKSSAPPVKENPPADITGTTVNPDVAVRREKNHSAGVAAGGIAAGHESLSDNSVEKPVTNDIARDEQSDRGELYAMQAIHAELPVSENSSDIESSFSFKPSGKYYCGHVSYQVSVYGGVNYVSKSLSATSEWQNYLNHRENEEINIFTPAFGVSMTATVSKFSLTLGAEYAVYGEKTNYYPYSLQQSLVQNGDWTYNTVTYTQTDTGFYIGNRYFIQSQQTRVDSTFDSQIDTVEEYKYDQAIAEKNGVNHITYVEVPIMFSYNLVSGKAGLGVSAGIAPGWLTSRSGYYLRSDGKGLESLEEIESFRKFMMNGRIGIDMYYRMNGRMCLTLRPQLKTNLNSVFENDYGVKQKYTSTGVLFGVSWLLN